MKQLYIVARNHMDPSWLRCFRDHFTLEQYGGVVHPYSDIEELQILEYMDFAEKHGVKYHLEQSIVVKEFLARNPDQRERFKALVDKGLFELAGGGEAVIDYNMTQGESWARNHLYSRTYYKEAFNHAPRYAIAPDTFGLPAQLPQFFRSVGYDALIIFDRVMLNNKPFWRGLDGTDIVLDQCFLNNPEPGLRTADCFKIPACAACKGEGCDLCEGTGIDFAYNMTRPDKDMTKFREAYYGNMSAEEALQELLKKDSDSYFLMIVTEEPRVGEYLYGPLEDAAKKMGFEVHYLTFEENHDRWCPGQVDRLRKGDYTEDEVDFRAEGNPVFAGCYSSRINVKKANRELEILLEEAEKLAVLARMQGGWDPSATPRRDYPQKKIEALWNKMAFIQFHDCLPGTVCDGGYQELVRWIRDVRRGAEQLYNDAALECLRTIGCDVPEGYKAAAYFNMDMNPVLNPRLSLQAPNGAKNALVFDVDGTPLTASDAEVITQQVGTGLRITVNAEVPALGWRIFLWKPVEEAEAIAVCDDLTIENEYFTVTADASGVTGVFDKLNNRPATGHVGLFISPEDGGAYCRNTPEHDYRALTPDSVTCEKGDGYSRLTMKGLVSDEQYQIHRLAWTQTYTLRKGEKQVRIATDLDWHGANSRVFVSVEPAFAHNGLLQCEVPFGMLERDDPAKAAHAGIADEWPTLGYTGVTDGQYNLAMLKGGFPASRLKDGKLEVVILRSVTYKGDTKYLTINDEGLHTSSCAITTWEGAFADGCASTLAASFNARGLTRPVTGAVSAASGCMLPALTNLPGNLRLSALKWAEDGSGPVVRFWESAGKSAVLTLPEGMKLQPCNTLEEPLTDTAVSEYAFRAFEIATFRLIIK